MDIKTTKLELMQMLLQTEKESILKKLQDVFEKEESDWWNELSFEEQQEIEEGLKQADNQEFISNDEVMKIFDKWH